MATSLTSTGVTFPDATSQTTAVTSAILNAKASLSGATFTGGITYVYARDSVLTDNDGSFDLNAGTNFKCTPTANFTLTFTNIPNGQSGTILLVNSGGYTVSAASTTKVMGADLLTTITTAGTYVLGYVSDGTNVRIYNSGAQQ